MLTPVQESHVVYARARDPGASAFPEEIRDACGVGLLADLHGKPGRHILPLALGALKRLSHRGAVDADGRAGDGAGVTTQMPFAVLRPELADLGWATARGMIWPWGLYFCRAWKAWPRRGCA